MDEKSVLDTKKHSQDKKVEYKIIPYKRSLNLIVFNFFFDLLFFFFNKKIF
jgi:hypothetical protein